MKKYYAVYLFLFLIISCKQDKTSESNALQFVSEKSVFIIQSNDLYSFINKIDSTAFFQKNITLLKSLPIEDLRNISKFTSSDKTSLLSFTKSKSGYEYLYITEFKEGFFDLDSTKNKTVETLTIEGETLKKYTLDNLMVFTTVKKWRFYSE